MTANELRIGNWYLFGEDSFPERMRLESFVILHKYPERINWIKPIELSPEVLERAGFKYMKSLDGQHYWNNKFGITQINFHEWYTEWELLNNPCPQNKIQYLHQLQNLYFALTGTELEINLNP